MRFRLATSGTGGGGQELAGGVGNLFRSIAMAPAMAAQASLEAQDAQAQRDLRGAQMRSADAAALFDIGKAQEIEDQRRRTSVGGMLETGMLQHGVPLNQQADFGAYLQTGQKPAQYKPGADDMGPYLPTPKMYEDDTGAKILQTLGMLNKSLTVGDNNVLNLTKAEQAQRDMNLGDQVIAGQVDPTKVSQARFATTGGPAPFEFKEFGTGNQVTGQLDETTGAAQRYGQLRQSEIKENNAQANSANASAENSRASADHHRASTRKVLMEVENGVLGGKGKLASPKEKFDAENKLRDEFQKQTKDFGIVRDAFAKVNVAATDPNAASDIALIFAYMKMLDPTSVVREGEFATAQNAGGIPDRVVNMYNRAINGTRLNDQQRRNFVGEAKKVYKAQTESLDTTRKTYTDLGARYGLDVRNIVTDFAPVTETQIGAPGPAAAPARVTSDAEYNALPPGTTFIGPDGKQRRKP